MYLQEILYPGSRFLSWLQEKYFLMTRTSPYMVAADPVWCK